MPMDLPPPVAAYFAADGGDGAAVALCFTDDGVVKDESHVHRGRAAIAAWKSAASARYNYRSEPLAAEQAGGDTLVTARVAGDFPGSPIELRYRFAIEGDRISTLEIGT